MSIVEHKRKISVIGLGYVGLPMAIAFGKSAQVIGYDISQTRIKELKNGFDKTKEVANTELLNTNIVFTNSPKNLCDADFHIVTVPTPVNDAYQPDLSFLVNVSHTIGKILKPGMIVVYESTVYPGVTEDVCIPILEKVSQLKCGHDFNVGYSPERINPGDKENTFTKVKKVVSAQNKECLDVMTNVYGSVVRAGVHQVKSIKIAESAKIVENAQRDINIAFMNELAVLFNTLNIDILDVLEVAKTKWNFLNFKPGLVGGHCIGVDPYYLIHKAESVGYIPEIMSHSRKINNSIGYFITENILNKLSSKGVDIGNCTISILGVTFKENCPDTRNSRVIDIIEKLRSYNIKIQICDPIADKDSTREEYNIQLVDLENLQPSDAIFIAVPHDIFTKLPILTYKKLLKPVSIIVDIKGIICRDQAVNNGIDVWRL